MPKTKPTYDDLVSALISIFGLTDGVEDKFALSQIRDICKEMLPE